jgi:hypothetical protein
MTNASELGTERPQPSDPHTLPAPADPPEPEPVRDSPIYPEYDDAPEEVRQTRGADGVEATDGSADAVDYSGAVE